MVAVRLNSAAEVADCLRDHAGPFDVVGSDSKREFRIPVEGRTLLSVGTAGIVEWSPEDQVVVVGAATEVAELQKELKTRNQKLPTRLDSGTVAGSLSANLPHVFERAGGWRDWVLGMTVVLPNGDIVKCGSKAVKNVAGYDLHKLFIGARGTLGAITEVVLRTYPHKCVGDQSWHARDGKVGLCQWIQRALPADAKKSFQIETGYKCWLDPDAGTIWTSLGEGETLPRYPGDWVLRSNSGKENIVIENPAQREYMKRLKQRLDPANKLNPGEFGFI